MSLDLNAACKHSQEKFSGEAECKKNQPDQAGYRKEIDLI